MAVLKLFSFFLYVIRYSINDDVGFQDPALGKLDSISKVPALKALSQKNKEMKYQHLQDL
ncbi:Hypothetical predicted protein [Scomber scombrus]|uniref:Uncharacterized protein n=1 Tax=Scomber scombrus TaxID=13677 RepID=A0AAV1PU37_SCOSC